MVSGPRSLLDVLRERTLVDCDTLDADIARRLQPFQDCTSNQAIAAYAIIDPAYADIVKDAVKLARDVAAEYPEVTTEAVAVEIFMISLQLRVVPFLRGCIHIQVNPFDAYSVRRTIAGAQRIVQLCRRLDASFDTSRICIKVPCTWEGMQACAELERSGIKTLATTLFTMEQAALAGEVRCHYIAPYVNELRAQIDKSYTDPAPLRDLCVEAQRYYERYRLPTQVLPASLVSVEECMSFAGAHHITIAPYLLFQLSETAAPDDPSKFPSLFDTPSEEAIRLPSDYLNDEAGYRIAFTRNKNGVNEPKLCQALNVFCDKQEELEEHIRKFM